MADRPILFSGPMVRALLAGTKTQTRRVAKFVEPHGDGWHIHSSGGGMFTASDEDVRVDGPYYAPYSVGDCLYVREAWRTAAHLDRFPPRQLPVDTPVFFEADSGGDSNGSGGKLRPGMFLPRWASRLTIIVTEVRVQRLQDITEEDAVAEGVEVKSADRDWFGYRDYLNPKVMNPAARGSYRTLWDSLNADRGYGWESNPWLVAVSFTVHRGNIDQMPALTEER